jgi:NTP pyrophosphatase (non-canonical NTP hydrolase)
MELDRLVDESWRITERLGRWRPEVRALALVEEVGELAHAVLAREGYKARQADTEELDRAIAGVLFDVLVLARQYEVPLGEAYVEGLALLERRTEKIPPDHKQTTLRES